MMSPLMEMQTLSPAIYSEKEMDAKDEFREGTGTTKLQENRNRFFKLSAEIK